MGKKKTSIGRSDGALAAFVARNTQTRKKAKAIRLGAEEEEEGGKERRTAGIGIFVVVVGGGGKDRKDV